ncbi:flavin reductase family protein [Pseudonocardia dioxanivorans]|jgi:flavin reductase (DIM6/NTAB) family NADH-FMN oxidoreductase RutF|uniref:flavin reductase family protein n=1 Tax=Pseudonocardia dioxanivorans TaxID=240495 RepID=UPI000CD1BA20|nr:flavin reductase family protein [Pseudonocardia dioxanivorans]
MIIDTSTLDAASAYKLLIGSIVPRPIGWISTMSVDGVANLAPISFFTCVGRKPPMVSITMQPRSDGQLKDTFVNVRDTGEFCFNLVSLPHAHHAHRSAAEFPTEVDEFDVLGLGKAPSDVVAVPRVDGAPISFECTLERVIPVGNDDHVVFGIVQRVHIRDDLYLEGGRVDTAALGPVGRLAAEYTLVENVFTTPLDDEILAARHPARMHRLDGRPTEFSPIGTKAWSPSGSVMD